MVKKTEVSSEVVKKKKNKKQKRCKISGLPN